MSVGTLTVNLLMKTGQFETDTKRAERRAKQMADNINKSVKIAGAALAGAAIAGVAAFANEMKNAIDRADEMSKAAQKIGVTTESLSRLSYAADLSGVSIEQLQTSLAKLVKYQSAAAGGNKDAIDTFKALGIAVTDSTGNLRNSEQVLSDFAAIFKQLPDGANKTALALKVFGKSGAELIPLLNGGADGLARMSDESDRFGNTISTKAGKQAEEFNDNLSRVKTQLQGVALAVAVDLLPDLVRFSESLQDINNDSSKTSSTVKDIADAFRLLGVAVQSVGVAYRLYKEQGIFGDGVIKTMQNETAERDKQAALYDSNLAKVRSGPQNGSSSRGRGPRLKSSADVQSQVRNALAGSTAVVNTGASKAAAEASRAKAEADREAADAARDLDSAYQSLNSVLDAQAIELGGDLVQAAISYREEMVEIQKVEDELIKQHKLDESTQASLNQAREQALGLYQKTTDAINAQLSPAEEELTQLRTELELLGLTNDERAKRAFLLNNPGSTDAQATEAAGLVSAIDQAQRATQAMDNFRNSASDALAGFIDGSMSAKDAFTAFADSVIQQIANILAEQAIASLFGNQGQSGGGGYGDAIGSIFSSLFGGGRASGGGVSGNRMYRVNENGPEILNYKGDDFLMMGGNSGFVKQRGGGGSSHVTVNVSPITERRAALQIAQRVAEKQRTAITRNG